MQNAFGIKNFDEADRTVITEYSDFSLFNVYFPSGKTCPERLFYEMEFYDAFLDFIGPLQKQDKKLIVCGDFNTAHYEIDLARPNRMKTSTVFYSKRRL